MITFLVLAIPGLALAHAVTRRRNAGEARRGLQQASALGLANASPGAPGRLPILMPVSGRPHYLRQVLDALSRVRGIESAVVVVSQDGHDDEVSELVAGIRFTDVIVLRHERPFLGVFAYFWDSLHAIGAQIRFLLDFSLRDLDAEYAIVLEDDIVPSPDFLRYFEWACPQVLADERVMSVTGYNFHSRMGPELDFDPRHHPHDLVEIRDGGQPKFTGWGWAISRETWKRVRGDFSTLSWDIGLDRTQRKRRMISYKPVLARAKNIGMQGGINFTEAEGNPKWADLVLAERPYPDEHPPRLLQDDPARPAFVDAAPAEPIRNERQRTRARRLWLAAGVAAMTVAEIAAWRAFVT